MFTVCSRPEDGLVTYAETYRQTGLRDTERHTADWHFLTHDNILHNKKGIKWNAPFLSTKQALYYLFITFGT
jgi:hypothetical protein